MELQAHYRQATTEEIDYYQHVLYPLQDEVFAIARVYEQNLYLTGGTALARFHFQHRLSEDLDFFGNIYSKEHTQDLMMILGKIISLMLKRGCSLRKKALRKISKF